MIAAFHIRIAHPQQYHGNNLVTFSGIALYYSNNT